MMAAELSLFFFVLLGSKIVLGAVAVYMLLPRDGRCVTCDAEMLPLEHARGTRHALRLLGLQRRWCMECRREVLGRCAVPGRSRAPHTAPVAEPRLR